MTADREEFFRDRAEAFQRRCDALEKLLACYRSGSQPSERLHRDLQRTRDALHALSNFPPKCGRDELQARLSGSGEQHDG